MPLLDFTDYYIVFLRKKTYVLICFDVLEFLLCEWYLVQILQNLELAYK